MKDTENRERYVLDVLENVHNLPSAPVVMAEVTKLLDNPNANATDLSKVISRDQGLVTKILVVANSPLYGIPRRVSTIDFAIVILGFNQIKNIVISLAMMEAFKSIKGKKFEQKKYWQHSIMTAFISKKIADDLGYFFSGEAFTAGLLHDLGIPLIFKFFNKEYCEIFDKAIENDLCFDNLEREILGTTHSKIGAFLIDKWNLPKALAEVVNFHHTPNLAQKEYSEITAVVHLADYLLNYLKIGGFVWDNKIELDNSIYEILQLSGKEYLDGLIEKYKPLIEEQINNTFI